MRRQTTGEKDGEIRSAGGLVWNCGHGIKGGLVWNCGVDFSNGQVGIVCQSTPLGGGRKEGRSERGAWIGDADGVIHGSLAAGEVIREILFMSRIREKLGESNTLQRRPAR